MNTSKPAPSPDTFALFVVAPEPWMAEALCAETDPELFFPEKGGNQTDAAKRVCAKCDVRAQCLEYAVRNGERFGVWGGVPAHKIRAMTAKARRSRASDTEEEVRVDAP